MAISAGVADDESKMLTFTVSFVCAAWLAATAIRIGEPLRAGDVVLSGALGPMIAVEPGDVFTAEIPPLGTVTARFSLKDQ